MFIWSVKLNRNILWGLCAAVCLSLGAFAAFSPKETTDVLKNSIDTTAKTTEQQVAILKTFGYEVDSQPLLIEEIIIPSEFDEEYNHYNEFQKISGFDLSKYQGTRMKRYTYLVSDYPDAQGEVHANLYVYNGKVVGGDVASASPDGFVHGLIKE